MRIIKEITKSIREELCDAERYAKQSLERKDSDKELAGVYRSLAEQELSHAEQLHGQAVRLIREFQQTGQEVPPAMQAIWDWEHEQMIEQKTEIKLMLSM